jgi:hypothetical protein
MWSQEAVANGLIQACYEWPSNCGYCLFAIR